MRSKLFTLAFLAIPAAALFAMPTESKADNWGRGSYYSRPSYGYGGGSYYRGYNQGYSRGGYGRSYNQGYYNRGYSGRGYGNQGYYGRGRSVYFTSPWGSFQYNRR